MTRDETVALFLQGREAWNAWAEKMLAERKALEDAGDWFAEKDPYGSLKPKNAETRTWTTATAADFSYCQFTAKGTEWLPKKAITQVRVEEDSIDFSGFSFPGDADFGSTTFSSFARFEGTAFMGVGVFSDATFSRACSFASTLFSGEASFGGATFSGEGYFKNIGMTAQFEGTKFLGTAWFPDATFSGHAVFENAIFSGHVRFAGTTFSDSVTFIRATFPKLARFDGATFQKAASFAQAKFLMEAEFSGIKVERAFDMTGAEFFEVPAFNQADFKQAPDLDDVRFPLPDFWRAGKAKLAAQYRAIRRMAIQGADYEREQMAYKGELRSRRWTVDRWWSIGTWIGLFYDAFADCGRSIVRPANTWLASILVFAAFYWQRAAVGAGAHCEEAGGAAVQALFLSVKNALVIFGGTRDARVNQAYLCLYDGKPELPHIPPTVTFVETLAQIPVSATLIFLFLLAVKNRFKIK